MLEYCSKQSSNQLGGIAQQAYHAQHDTRLICSKSHTLRLITVKSNILFLLTPQLLVLVVSEVIADPVSVVVDRQQEHLHSRIAYQRRPSVIRSNTANLRSCVNRDNLAAKGRSSDTPVARFLPLAKEVLRPCTIGYVALLSRPTTSSTSKHYVLHLRVSIGILFHE